MGLTGVWSDARADAGVQAKCVAVKGRMMVHLEMCRERIRKLNSEGWGDFGWHWPWCVEVVCLTGAGLVCTAEKLQSSPATAGDSPVFASSSFQNYGKVLSVAGLPSDKGKQKQPSSSRSKGRVLGPEGVGRAKAKANSPPTQSQTQKKVTVGQTSSLLVAGWCVCVCVLDCPAPCSPGPVHSPRLSPKRPSGPLTSEE